MDSIYILLKKEIESLSKSLDVLEHSLNICLKSLDNNSISKLSLEELDAFESLTARFSRTSDILIQKYLRTIEEIELEYSNSVRDRINLAEKKGIIENASELIQIRLLRNQIAHEYTEEEIIQIFKEVIQKSPSLISMTRKAINYSLKYF